MPATFCFYQNYEEKDTEGNLISNKAADSDATYTSNRGQKYHGYKIHIATDTNGMIKEVCTTTAKEADIKQLENLSKKRKSSFIQIALYLQKERVEKEKYFGGIIERRESSKKQKGPNNYKKAKKRLANVSVHYRYFHQKNPILGL